MFGCGVVIRTLICSLYVSNQVFISCHGFRPCHVLQDHNDISVDCSNCHLSSRDIFKFDYSTATRLIISNNDIVTLRNETFSRFKHLKRLECVSCNLQTLEMDALKGLDKLEVLCLNDNHLRIIDHAFPLGFFRHTPHITTLSIDSNNNDGHASIYSQYIDMFDFLPLLEELTIDSFSNLVIGKEFSRFDKLKTLRVHCKNLNSISDDSLKGFEDSSVKHFVLFDGIVYSRNIGFMVFQYLPINVSSLTLDGLNLGNINSMKMMQTLQGRKIDTIRLNGNGFHHTANVVSQVHDGTLTDKSTIFIRNVCVSHLEMNSNKIFALEGDSFFSKTWRRCLKSITITTKSMIMVDNIFWLHALRFENLKSFILMSEQHGADSNTWKGNFSVTTSMKTARCIKLPRIPHKLTTLYITDFASINVDAHYCVAKNNILSLSFPYCHFTFYGQISGLNSLAVLDFTGAKLEGYPEFFSSFPRLRKLVMRETRLTSDFLTRIVDYIPNLEYLDIAKNDLIYLPPGIFKYNRKLKYLCLASNRFSTIPFDLTLTPHLAILDLSGNTFVDLSVQDRLSINEHIQIASKFKLLLDNNELSCVCSSLQFLAWLQSHRYYMDQDGNYTCISEKGTMLYTVFFRDITSFTRECQGRSYFLISLILASTLASFYLAVFLGMKHKTQILSKMRQIVVPGFRLKTRHDFTFDVCIGYADQEGEYVRDVLLRYLENKWNLRTFVHQRDQLQDPLLFSQAQRDSYRNVLLITENFLQHWPMAHNAMKVATFFVSDTNPRSVVVMVEERVQHQIPDYVLQVVDDDNIIVVPMLQGFLDYEAKETLKTRIIL